MTSRVTRSAATAASLALLCVAGASADPSPRPLPLEQDWSATGLIFADDEWGAIRAVMGFRGDGLVAAEGVDPRTVLDDGGATPVDVIANQTSPDALGVGGVAEFELANPAVALQGSATADAPHLVLYLNTSGKGHVRVSYRLRDLDGSSDDAAQAVALQFRVGAAGPYRDVREAFVADATSGGSATRETIVSAALPPEAWNLPEVHVRVLTTNAAGADEWVGVDDISVVTAPPTAVGAHALSARRTQRGILVSWRAGLGGDALGFDVYRERAGTRVRLNQVPVRRALAGTTGGSRYGYLDRAAPAGRARYWLWSLRPGGLGSWLGPAATS